MTERGTMTSLLKERVLLLDGSYGAELIRRTGGGQIVPERLNIERPEIIRGLHEDYISSGADLILTNTFGATPVKLNENGLEDITEVAHKAVEAARKAASGRAFVIGDIGPTGILPYPLGEGMYDLYYHNFRSIAERLLAEGVDGIILETFSDMLELKTAVLAVRDLSKTVFLIAMMTFDGKGRTLTGTDPRNFALTFNDLDVDAVGINCSLGPEEMVPMFQELSRFSEKLLVVEPNAGLPVVENGRTRYPVGPDAMARFVETFCDLGANIVGGCCGTGPSHIAMMKKALGDRPPAERRIERTVSVSSPTRTVALDGFLTIGERINPAGRKKLRAAMEEGDLELIMGEARAQLETGAQVLDVNFGLESSVPIDLMERVVLSITYNLGAPLSLDVQTPSILERLMRTYPGRPMVNSSTCEKEDLMRKGGLVKDIGGLLIVLSMGKHVPKDHMERTDNVRNALAILKDMGIGIDRVLFDPIVLSLGAGNPPSDTLRTIERLKEEGLRTVLGLSNLSFGLPERSHYNSAFLVMAIEKGLSAAIMNPLDIPKGYVTASLVLSGRMSVPGADLERTEGLVRYLLEGNVEKALETTKGLSNDLGPVPVLEKHLKPAMEHVGVLYSQGKVFLPQIILAAQTSRPCFEHLERLLPSGGGKRKFIIATVKGDIHDIGKNIVASIIRGSGYQVLDLGKDIETEDIVAAVKEEEPLALGLSAMMTTTALRIKEVVEALRAEGIDVKVLAGGASLNEKVVKGYGADLYARDAMDAVRFLRSLEG